jgi:hypothetical protein
MDTKTKAIVLGIGVSLCLSVYSLYRLIDVEGSIPPPSQYDAETLKSGLDYLQSHLNDLKDEQAASAAEIEQLKRENLEMTKKFRDVCVLSTYEICVN